MSGYRNKTEFVLASLIPFTTPNMMATFKPSQFFYELSKIDYEHKKRLTQKQIHDAFYRLRKQGLVELDDEGCPHITDAGRRKVQRYVPRKLKGSKLLIAFDIEERSRAKRDQLRRLLKDLGFKPVQRSIWQSDMDYREYLLEEIKRLELGEQVLIYEARVLHS